MMKKFSQFGFALIATLSICVPLLMGAAGANAADEIQKAQCQQVDDVECFQAAQDPAVNQDCASAGAANCNVVDKYINPLIALVGTLGGIAITIGIIYGGIEYASSGGDPQKAASGKKHIKVAVVALIAMLFMYAFIKFLMPAGTTG